jgi:hypothetical protein
MVNGLRARKDSRYERLRKVKNFSSLINERIRQLHHSTQEESESVCDRKKEVLFHKVTVRMEDSCSAVTEFWSLARNKSGMRVSVLLTK